MASTQKKTVELGNSMFAAWLRLCQAKANGEVSGQAYYADQYFNYIASVLEAMPDDFVTADGFNPKGLVRAQIFMRHEPGCLVAGIDLAIATIVNSLSKDKRGLLSIEAIDDGTWVEYGGIADLVTPVMKLIGPYEVMAQLETSILGVLSRCTRIANHVLECLNAANGTPVLFFPQRFDSPFDQEMDGYAYYLAVAYYNKQYSLNLPVIVSSQAGAALFGKNGKSQGSTPHSLMAIFGGDEQAAMENFAKYLNPDIKRIFLADYHNDVISSIKGVAQVYWGHYMTAYLAKDETEMKRWRLWGIRIDTSAALIDRVMSDNAQTEGGVSPMLVEAVRAFMNRRLPEILVPDGDSLHRMIAREYCESLSITVTGGFGPSKIERFENGAGISQWRIPVNAYGVGSGMLKNDGSYDFTMDVVEAQRNKRWYSVAKVGRAPNFNENLKLVEKDLYLVD